MTTNLATEVMQDDLAISLARGMAMANKKARELGVNVVQSLISITQTQQNDGSVWRVNYGPKDYINQRGGDVLIEVDMLNIAITKIIRGQ
ncbi:MAG: hypothetical protein ACE5GO_02070 [Anaerolineales bacterium]